MGKQLDITDDERRQASRNIETFFMFTEDVLADPSLLDAMPDEATVEPLPVAERDPERRYDIATPRTVATVIAEHQVKPAHRKPA